jgi:hypothetical protein
VPALGLIGLVLVALLVFVTLGSRARAAEPAPAAKPPSEQKAAPMKTAGLTRQQIAAKLAELSKKEPPTRLSPGAECYKPSMPKESEEYLCPRCGARTHYSNNYDVAYLIRSLPAAREALKKIQGLEASLDESSLCQKCRGAATGTPSVALIVKYADGTTQRTRGITAEDLRLVSELLEGKDVHAGAQDMESPLKDHLARLQELLGVTPAK